MSSSSADWVSFLPLLVLCALWIWMGRQWRRRRNEIKMQRDAAPKGETRAVPNLLPWESYQRDETGNWGRVRIFASVCFVVIMTGVQFINRDPAVRPMLSVTVGLAGGLLFGTLVTWFVRRRVRRNEEGLYKAEGWIARPVPAGLDPEYQLLCGRMDEMKCLGGILYVGREELAFVPHWLNQGTAEVVRMSLLGEVDTKLAAPAAMNALQRFLVPRPRQQILITVEGETLRLVALGSTP